MTSAASSIGASTGAADPKAASPEIAKLRKAGTQFEAVFLRQMIGSMRSASLGDGLTDSDETRQFRDMQDSKVADTMAGKGVLGIADMLVKQWGARVSAGAATPDVTKVAAK